MSTYLRKHAQLHIELRGHTDNVGGTAFNQQLSQERAEKVREWLVEAGISSERISAIGFGESRPLADNDSEEGRARNRRTELVILGEE